MPVLQDQTSKTLELNAVRPSSAVSIVSFKSQNDEEKRLCQLFSTSKGYIHIYIYEAPSGLSPPGADRSLAEIP